MVRKTSGIILITALVAAAWVGLWLLFGATDEDTVMQSNSPVSEASPASAGLSTAESALLQSAPQSMGNEQTEGVAYTPEMPVEERPGYEFDPAVVESLRRSIAEGDPRAPALSDSVERELPTEAELADPQQYQLYEARQREKVFIAYVTAAKAKTASIEALIAQGERQGVSAVQLEEGREKLRKIQAMSEKLQRDYPHLFESQ